MTRTTKKQMIDEYPALKQREDLLELYLYDTQTGRQPDATEHHNEYKNGELDYSIRVQLWRATSASGGYVVIKETVPNIWLLDNAVYQFSECATQYNLGIRICLERLQIVRARLLKAA